MMTIINQYPAQAWGTPPENAIHVYKTALTVAETKHNGKEYRYFSNTMPPEAFLCKELLADGIDPATPIALVHGDVGTPSIRPLGEIASTADYWTAKGDIRLG
ncbi:hypothetical protein KCX83_15440 [Brucella oryzae]|uniref:hypothetical protein n=1 Tax=Brucella oryzae TaxID=335286 RepID=UPI001B830453|nr:hypothetical protein [Brucella oryzae]MBR7653713.1 hypothetical protein [Brucella oryzae]